MKVDPKFTKKIQEWLNNVPKKDEDALSGAQLLQQINPRNMMYRRFISLSVQRPACILPKITHELSVHLKYRLNGLTLEEVNRLDQQVIPEAAKIITEGKPADDADTLLLDGETPVVPIQVVLHPDAEPEAQQIVRQLGRREDHDQLPDNIRALWADNGNLYKEIKALFEELKAMNDLPSCHRYDKLQLLSSMDQRYFKQMKEYDEFVLPTNPEETVPTADDGEMTNDVDPAETAKAITLARSYISKNQKKLATLYQTAHADGATVEQVNAYMEFVGKMQARVNTLIAAGVVTDEMKETLSPIGIVFDSPVPDADTSDTESPEASE